MLPDVDVLSSQGYGPLFPRTMSLDLVHDEPDRPERRRLLGIRVGGIARNVLGIVGCQLRVVFAEALKRSSPDAAIMWRVGGRWVVGAREVPLALFGIRI